SAGDGTHTVTCPGGTTVVKDGERLMHGTIAGEAVRFGLPAAAGIEVTLVELDRTVATDDAGQFSFSDVPPGSYRLHLTLPGYSDLFVPNVSIFGGSVRVPSQALKIATRISLGPAVPIYAPGGRHVAINRLERGGFVGRLSIVDLASNEETFIG